MPRARVKSKCSVTGSAKSRRKTDKPTTPAWVRRCSPIRRCRCVASRFAVAHAGPIQLARVRQARSAVSRSGRRDQLRRRVDARRHRARCSASASSASTASADAATRCGSDVARRRIRVRHHERTAALRARLAGLVSSIASHAVFQRAHQIDYFSIAFMSLSTFARNSRRCM